MKTLSIEALEPRWLLSGVSQATAPDDGAVLPGDAYGAPLMADAPAAAGLQTLGAETIQGLGVAGDSLSDEYTGEWYDYAKNWNQLLAESAQLEGPDKRMTEIIETNASRLNDVIENILALSRRHVPNPEQLLLYPWLEQTLSELVQNSGLQSNQAALHVTPQSTALVADKKQLSQIVSALLENAVNHFPDQMNTLQLTVTAGVDSNNDRPFIEITDNGKGVPQEIVDKIFDPFFTTRNDGTGLGLYITKMLCDANNIRIAYLPVTGGGSCFRLRFPNTHDQGSTQS